MLWNNQPDREAFGLVRKGVGQSTVLRAVETPYPKVNPIQSNSLFLILCFGRNFHFCIVHHFRLSEVSGGSHIHEAGSKFVYGSDLTW